MQQIAVIEGIKAHAFEDNDMPVILSFENHCCHAQQKVMTEALIHIFRSNGLLLEPDSKSKIDFLPSPEQLRRKIIIKGKRGSLISDESSEHTASVDDEDEDEENESEWASKRSLGRSAIDGSMSSIGSKKKKNPKQSTHPELAAITYLGAAHAPKSFDLRTSQAIPCDIMSSYSETKTLKHLAKPRTIDQWVRHNAHHLRY